jgi:hypothetical protein
VGAEDFRAQPAFADFIERFLRVLAPMVHEIGQRSLMPSELVLRRALTDDRREEIFVSKATLREKYASLAPSVRALFTPLGLDAPPKGRTSAPPPPGTPSPVRAELPASQPPGPPSRPPPPMAPPPPPPVPSDLAPPKNEVLVTAL